MLSVGGFKRVLEMMGFYRGKFLHQLIVIGTKSLGFRIFAGAIYFKVTQVIIFDILNAYKKEFWVVL